VASLVPQFLNLPVNAATDIRVIIVNYNAAETIVACIQSVVEAGQAVNITLYDNASSDGSMQQIRDSCSSHEKLEIIQGTENIGFSRAINEAAQSRDEKYLLFLNPDCELLPGSLEYLKEALEEDAGAAMAGPLVVDRQGAVQKGTLRRFPDPWKSFLSVTGLWRLGRKFPSFKGVEHVHSDLPESTTAAEAVSGACMLVRREPFMDCGGMDEEYGLHCEDLDLMYRFRQRGFHCLFVPAARVIHQQGVSSRSRPLWVHRQKHLGMQRFFNKFQAGRYPFPLRWLVISGIWLRYALTLPGVLIRHR
jgi:GT2 family glycosyltransferase